MVRLGSCVFLFPAVVLLMCHVSMAGGGKKLCFANSVTLITVFHKASIGKYIAEKPAELNLIDKVRNICVPFLLVLVKIGIKRGGSAGLVSPWTAPFKATRLHRSRSSC